MANRQYRSQFNYSLVGMPVSIYAQINFGSTGAPTLAAGSMGISGVVRNGAGDYTVTFRDVYNSLIGIDWVFYTGGATAPASPDMWIRTDSTATAASKTMRIVFNTGGTATDPASGEKVYMVFRFNNSTVTG